MKKLFAIVSILLCVAFSSAESYAQMCKDKHFAVNQIRDLALIYQGGKTRIDWTVEQITPYVVHTFANGKKDWLFDGFLFLDFDDGSGNVFVPVWGKKNATKEIWEWYLDRLFERGKSLDALDMCIGMHKAEIGDPGFKHKVVLTLLTPIPGHKEWGKLNGKALDFTKYEDQTAAVGWYIDKIVSRFNEQGYKNLELTGLYWVDEDVCHTKELTKYVAPLVHAKNLEFVWIPYFRARGYDRWRELGFDIVYHQPNHFFKKNIPDSRLDEAIDVALNYGMAMEFECDSKALYNIEDSSYDRMTAYIDAFVRQHVFSTSAIAYYTGSKSFIDMIDKPCPENQAIMDRLAGFIVERRKNPALVP